MNRVTTKPGAQRSGLVSARPRAEGYAMPRAHDGTPTADATADPPPGVTGVCTTRGG
jgi:hypothetical protein